MRIYNDFIGSDDSNTTLKFIGGDSEKQFIQAIEKMPKDWYYNNTEILYNYNNLGHRCKNFEDLDQDNYILFIGCSHTMGVGLELEKTYPYLLSKSLSCDYYNLGMGGSGIDVLLHNLIVWFGTVKQKPKLVIIQWPFWARYARFIREPTNATLLSTRISTIGGVIDPTLMEVESVHYFKTIEHLAKIKLNHMIDVPIINIGLAEYPSIINDDFIIFDYLDYARDLHFGIESHENLASKLYHRINKINTI